jgi:hypothetical protein
MPRAGRLRGSALRGWSARLDAESKLFEHLDRAGLPALEISGGKALARGELGVVVIAPFNTFYWLRSGETPRPRTS